MPTLPPPPCACAWASAAACSPLRNDSSSCWSECCGRRAPPLRLRLDGPNLVGPDGKHVLLNGVNWYLEWYEKFHATAIDDVKKLRHLLPSANVVRFVALLWQDSNGPSDGMECSTEDASAGYLRPHCLVMIRAAVEQLTSAGLWVILSARAKYAAGYTWPDDPDIFHNAQLRQRFYAMWRFVAREFASYSRIAGYEIMSEPRTRSVRQEAVMDVLAGGCDAVHASDPRAMCVVGPAPYYQMWELPNTRLPDGRQNVMYTFNFYTPGKFVAGNSAASAAKGEEPPSFPGWYSCKDVFGTWWRGNCPSDPFWFDAAFMHEVIGTFAGKLRERLRAPVLCNQWGVKDEVGHAQGRLDYAAALLSAFKAHNVSATYWIWRSYAKGGRDVQKDEWGYELVHNPGHDDQGHLLPEYIEPAMTSVLQQGFARTNPSPMPPCVDDWSNQQTDEPPPLAKGAQSALASAAPCRFIAAPAVAARGPAIMCAIAATASTSTSDWFAVGGRIGLE